MKSTGPSSGSAEMNLFAAGVCSSSGIRSSAVAWFSQETPSQTRGFGRPSGQPGAEYRSTKSRIRSGRFVSTKCVCCGLRAIVAKQRSIQSSGTQAPNMSVMSHQKYRVGFLRRRTSSSFVASSSVTMSLKRR